jgi:hypothetical protein
MSAFGDSLQALAEQVGHGDLVGSVTFSGPHAAPQHEGPGSRFAPPSWAGKTKLRYTTPGTGPMYLSGPLLAEHPRYLQQIANGLYTEGPRRSMRDAMDDLKAAAQRKVPREKSDLADSARVHVTDNGAEWAG